MRSGLRLKTPSAGGLPSESLEYGYNELSVPMTLNGATGYVQNTGYTKLSDIKQITLGVSPSDTAKWLQISNTPSSRPPLQPSNLWRITKGGM
ncbi:hypothetical protein AB0N87_29040 [Streptomyces sp. NPDC093228]|uniref:hypothetical protein n=1 Tax=Streptomyces sp. NPDC093228 TaxID=3155070 RepID=UPI0034440B00